MRFPATSWLIGGVAAAALAAGCSSPAAQQPKPGPFTPEVDEFVAIYLKAGGDKLTNWVQGERVSRPDDALRAFKTIGGLTMELVASEPVIRQPIDLQFDDRGRLWVVQYLQYPFPAGLAVTSYDQSLGNARQAGSTSHGSCHGRARQECVLDPLCAVSSDGRERHAEARPAAEKLAMGIGSEDLLGRIVLNGLKGEMLMPAMGTLDDQQLSDILTYVRGAWGHAAGSISPETVGRIRSRSEGRAPWTPAELSALGRRE